MHFLTDDNCFKTNRNNLPLWQFFWRPRWIGRTVKASQTTVIRTSTMPAWYSSYGRFGKFLTSWKPSYKPSRWPTGSRRSTSSFDACDVHGCSSSKPGTSSLPSRLAILSAVGNARAPNCQGGHPTNEKKENTDWLAGSQYNGSCTSITQIIAQNLNIAIKIKNEKLAMETSRI